MGHYIRKHQKPNFQPFFRVQEVKYIESAQNIYVTDSIIREMTDRGLFYLGTIVIPVTSKSSLLSMDLHMTENLRNSPKCLGFPISGFPRSLADSEPLMKASKLPYPISRAGN